jgi:hypothetical protein
MPGLREKGVTGGLLYLVFVGVPVCLTCMLSGLVLIAFGLFLSRRRRDDRERCDPAATFCSLLYAAGHSPPYVMDQIGHAGATLALEMYANVMKLVKEDGPIDDLVASFGTHFRYSTRKTPEPIATPDNENQRFCEAAGQGLEP